MSSNNDNYVLTVAVRNSSKEVALRNSYYGQAVIDVLFSVYISIAEWYEGKITGERCAMNIINDIATATGVLGGGATGAAIGSFGGPIGAAIGGIAGSLIGGFTASALSKMLTKEIFDLPKSKALEDAYKFMGLYHRCSNEEVNQRYKELALKYHPDKGGDEKMFQKLPVYVSIIKADRE